MEVSGAVHEWDSPVRVIDQGIEFEVADRVLTAARKYAVDINEAKLAEIIRGDQERYRRAYREGYEAGYESGYRKAVEGAEAE